MPELHGSIAAGLAAGTTSVSDALRYDGYGVDPAVPSLYDFGFREYAPSLGAFTSIDDLVGSAQDPASLNRFLYAAANPATLIDPDGHVSCSAMGADAADCNALSNGTGNSGDSTAVQARRRADAAAAPVASAPANSTPIQAQPAPQAGPVRAAYEPPYTDADAIWDCYHGGVAPMYDCDAYRQLTAEKGEARGRGTGVAEDATFWLTASLDALRASVGVVRKRYGDEAARLLEENIGAGVAYRAAWYWEGVARTGSRALGGLGLGTTALGTWEDESRYAGDPLKRALRTGVRTALSWGGSVLTGVGATAACAWLGPGALVCGAVGFLTGVGAGEVGDEFGKLINERVLP